MKKPDFTKRDARNFFLGAAVMVIVMAVIELFKGKTQSGNTWNNPAH